MHHHNDLTIGAAARRARCPIPTIRYYEEIGLLPEATRTAGGHRLYGDADLHRLIFIRRCRDFGFPIERVRELVSLLGSPERDCTVARDLAQAHLDDVRKRLKELRALERGLKAFVENCTTRCAGGPSRSCVILEDLASPEQAARAGHEPQAAASTCCSKQAQRIAAPVGPG
jgi:DNA-binding transcriptional MerR regulator